MFTSRNNEKVRGKHQRVLKETIHDVITRKASNRTSSFEWKSQERHHFHFKRHMDDLQTQSSLKQAIFYQKENFGIVSEYIQPSRLRNWIN